MFHNKLGKTIECELCFRHCTIPLNKWGFCRVRANVDGELKLPYYGMISAFAKDPIEKKPLYHYHPGSYILSVGYWGCNLDCPFCQNWRISRKTPKPREQRRISPRELIEMVKEEGEEAICHTYSEPEIHIEYLLETGEIAREEQIRSVLVTNGSLTPKAAEELYASMDAVNIDLKAMDPGTYRSFLKGNLEAVLENIEIAVQQSHVEITTLIVPSQNDSEEELRRIAGYLRDLEQRYQKTIPLHLSRYYPQYRHEGQATPIETLKRLKQIAGEYLDYVYLGNLPESPDTLCPNCRQPVIKRSGYRIETCFTEEGTSVLCPNCSSPLPIVP